LLHPLQAFLALEGRLQIELHTFSCVQALPKQFMAYLLQIAGPGRASSEDFTKIFMDGRIIINHQDSVIPCCIEGVHEEQEVPITSTDS